MTAKVGMRGQPPVVAVSPASKPTYEELEAEIKRLRGKLDVTAKLADDNKKLAKDRGDQIEWLLREQRKTKK